MSRPFALFRPHQAANRVFVNRDGPLKMLQERLQLLTPDSCDLLVFFGVGGQGKTSLCREFFKQLRDGGNESIKPGLVDLHGRKSIDQRLGLLWIRNALAVNKGMNFPAFDLGFALYWTLTHPEERAPAFEGSKWLGEVESATASAVGEGGVTLLKEILLVGVESVPFVGKALERLTTWGIKEGRRRYTIRTNQAVRQLFDVNGEPLHFTEIERLLPALLASDLEEIIDSKPETRFVVLVDEFERVVEQGGVSSRLHSSAFSDTLRDLVAHTNACLFVFFSRERLPWAYQPPAGADPLVWAKWIDGAHHLLGGLTRADANRFLQLVPVPDAAAREAIIDGASLASGAAEVMVYPLILDLQVDIYLGNLIDGKLSVDVDSFRAPANSFEDLRRKLLVRLLRDYGPATESVLTRLAVTRGFNRALFARVVMRFNAGFPIEQFQWLTELSFIEPATLAGDFTMLRVVRESLGELLSPVDRRETHQCLADYFVELARLDRADGALQNEQIRALTEAVYHRVALDPAEAARWWIDVREPFFNRVEVGALLPLDRQVIEGLSRQAPEQASLRAALLQKHSRELGSVGRVEEAIETISEAIDIVRRAGDDAREALVTALLLKASLLQRADRLIDAEFVTDEVQDALGALDPDDSQWVNRAALELVADGLERQGLYAQAEPLRRDRLRLIEQAYPDRSHEFVFRAWMALIGNLMQQGRVADGESQVGEFTTALQECNLDALKQLDLLDDIARLLVSFGREAFARRLGADAFRRLGGIELPNDPIARHNMLLVRSSLASLSGDAQSGREAAIALLEHVEASPAHADDDLVHPLLMHAARLLECGDIEGSRKSMERLRKVGDSIGRLPVDFTLRFLQLELQHVAVSNKFEENWARGEMPDDASRSTAALIVARMNQLGGVRMVLDIMEAEAAICEERYGPDHLVTLFTTLGLCQQYMLCNEPSAARASAERALPRVVAKFGERSAYLVLPLLVLAATEPLLGPSRIEADPIARLDSLVHEADPPLGPLELLRYAELKLGIGYGRGELESVASVLTFVKESLKSSVNNPKFVEEMLTLLQLLADMWSAAAGHSELDESIVAKAAQAKNVWGPKHLITMIAHHLAADYFENEGRYGMAADMRLVAITVQQALAGADTEAMRLRMADVGRALMKAGRVIEATPWLRKATRAISDPQDIAWWALVTTEAANAEYLRGGSVDAERLALAVLARAVSPECVQPRIDCLELLALQAVLAGDSLVAQERCHQILAEIQPLPVDSFSRIRAELGAAAIFEQLRKPAEVGTALDRVRAVAAQHWPEVEWIAHECHLLEWAAHVSVTPAQSPPGIGTEDVMATLAALRAAIGEATHKYGSRLIRAAPVLLALGDQQRAVAVLREGIPMLEGSCGKFHPALAGARTLLSGAE